MNKYLVITHSLICIYLSALFGGCGSQAEPPKQPQIVRKKIVAKTKQTRPTKKSKTAKLKQPSSISRPKSDISKTPTIKTSKEKGVSSAKPKIAQYPFTTKEIHVGHFEKKERNIVKRYQIIDTPGLLDRPQLKRNEIEKQAIAALTHLAHIIIFLIDPSETSGYSLIDQMNLLTHIKKMFTESIIIVVENKLDLKKVESKNLGFLQNKKRNRIHFPIKRD